MSAISPLREQYLKIKSEYPDCLLFFRLGDFYETFDEDAHVVAKELDIVLTGRSFRKGVRVPMAGVPHHSLENYLAILLERGHHIAICDQVGSSQSAKGLVRREVTRVLTPGTLHEPSLLTEQESNYLLALVPRGNEENKWVQVGLAYCDYSTGELAVTEFSGEETSLKVLEELARVNPREVLLPESWAAGDISLPPQMHLSSVPDWVCESERADRELRSHFQLQTLQGLGIEEMSLATAATAAILHYLRNTQKSSAAQLRQLRVYSTSQFMVLDAATRRNLELTEAIRSREKKGSLLSILESTETPMGGRLLRSWIQQPLLEVKRLNARLNAVEALTQRDAKREAIRENLREIADLERLTQRILLERAGPQELLSLKRGLLAVPTIKSILNEEEALSPIRRQLLDCEEITDLIEKSIAEDAPALLQKTGSIRAEYSEELIDILEQTASSRKWIAELEPRERARTGIHNLKVGYNRVFGYYLEVNKSQEGKVPGEYIRKQTLVNAERYITPELKDLEVQVLSAEEQILACERRIYAGILRQIAAHSDALLQTANAIAILDVLLSFALVAVREAYCRPQLTEENILQIQNGRHPVVEHLLPDEMQYIANDTHLDAQSRIHIITGPNMSGKSTYIRQVAIITLMAQIGSFVPADEATIGIVDRVFARIGAQDEIHAGQSTFMVEMVETARLLLGSSERSLLIIDEVGRGTSTYDGLAIARAVLEYIHDQEQLNCRTLFATHFHELTELPNTLSRAENYNVLVSEEDGRIIFTHRLSPGSANRSYGVHVAQLAGMPRPVVQRAQKLLQQLEGLVANLQSLPSPAMSMETDATQVIANESDNFADDELVSTNDEESAVASEGGQLSLFENGNAG